MSGFLAYIIFAVVVFAIILAVVYSIIKLIPFWVKLLLVVLTATGLITLEHWKGVATSVVSVVYSVVMDVATSIFGSSASDQAETTVSD